MMKKPFTYKLLFGLVFISLILPIKTPAAPGEARLCCKIFCSHKVQAMKAHAHGDMKRCGENPSAAHVQCCQDRCASVVGVKSFPTIAAAKILPGVPSVKSTFLAAAADYGDSGVLPQALPVPGRLALHCGQAKSPPLFLLQSVFRL